MYFVLQSLGAKSGALLNLFQIQGCYHLVRNIQWLGEDSSPQGAGILGLLPGEELLNPEEPATSHLLLSRVYPAKRPKQKGGIIYGVSVTVQSQCLSSQSPHTVFLPLGFRVQKSGNRVSFCYSFNIVT